MSTTTLLALTPLAGLSSHDSEETDSENETAESTAGVCFSNFEDIFDFYRVNVHEWVVCQLADNCSTNKRIADLLDVPHVGWSSPTLHLDVKRMIQL